MTDTPKGWETVRLDECLELVNGRAYSQSELLQDGTPVLRIQNLNGGHRWYYSDLVLGPEKYCEAGDLLYAWSATFGPYIYSGPRAIYHYHIWKVIPRVELIDKRFSFHTLRRITDEVKAAAHGVAMPHMTKAGMERWSIVLPPLAEQRRIVEKIDVLTAKSRRAKEALDAIPALLERFRQSVLAAAFRGDLTADWREKNPDVEPAEELLKRIRAERRRRWEEAELAKMRAKGKVPGDDRWKEKYEEPEPVDASELPELPEGWAWATMTELAWDTGYGTSEKCDYSGQGAPVLRIPNIAKGKLNLADLKRALRRGELDPADALHVGDLLVVRTNGSKDLIGRAALVYDPLPEPHHFASYLIRFRLLGSEQLPRWIATVWNSPQVRDLIESMAATSAGQYNVSLGNLNGLPIPIPPVVEQNEVVRILKGSIASVEHLETLIGDMLEQVHTLDRAILAKAFRGKLVPQDPNDEPASVLLERLRAEREQNGKLTNGAGRRRAAASPPPAASNPAAHGGKPQASRRSEAPARSRG
ncbi:restriction endonuclease subunit S [Sorangium sp. So ce513]|uniref:restriction endonuclease subunit S n=1 Tax=Sorangium sp. So ce513 TaxID=3133315 RepID=UPI003F62A0AD